MDTKYDIFESKRRIPYLLELFRIQTMNVLNANKYRNDPLLHVPEDEFELCKPNEWFRATDLLDGSAPATLEIKKSRVEKIKQ